MKKPGFVHTTAIHNISSPRIIVPLVLKHIKPNSVVDVGCGTGRFLRVFMENGVPEILGIDGAWVNRALLLENIESSSFEAVEFETTPYFHKDRKFDLGVCCEVLEHISKSRSRFMVENLTHLSDVILFSAALPGQGGQNHINEQPVQFWISLFNEFGFVFKDVFRSVLWDNTEVQRWFSQNLYLVVRKGTELDNKISSTTVVLPNAVHPDVLLKKANLLDDYRKARLSPLVYIKLAFKSLLK
jgi:SAM-dependent methyltransferase